MTLRTLTYVSPDLIKPDLRNPKKHSPAQLRALKKSIQAFGFNAPILVDRNMQVIAGHARREAALSLGLHEVPIISLDDLNEAQAKAFMLADNKIAELASWDETLLAEHLQELSEIPLDFDLDAMGFEPQEVDLSILALNEPEADPEDEVPVPTGPAVSRPGDCWLLRDHLIYCGSALDAASYREFPQATAVFTDPPYNVPIAGHVGGRGKIKHREFLQGAGELTEAEFTTFLREALKLAKDRCRSGALLYCCMDWRGLNQLQAAATACGLDQINLCVWAKTNPGMGTLYRSGHELIGVFRNGPETHLNNVQLGRFGRNRSNVWHYPGANVPGGKSALKYHPTPKPIQLVADAMLDCTARGDYVLDPFLGSGTTVLAAERVGRKALGIELDPIYVDTAIARWQDITGDSAKRLDGKSFAEVKAERVAP